MTVFYRIFFLLVRFMQTVALKCTLSAVHCLIGGSLVRKLQSVRISLCSFGAVIAVLNIHTHTCTSV